MHFAQLASVLAIAPVILAQYGGGSSSSSNAATPATSSNGNLIVKVGEKGLTFDPANVTAAVGSTIEFHFYPQAHSVAQAAFDKPCLPLGGMGFFSGKVPTNTTGVASPNVYTVKVADTKPIWFYCATGEHCQGGMVGVVNAPGGNKTLENFVEAAKLATANVEPSATQGGTLGPASTGTGAGTGTGTPASTGAPAAATTSQSAGVVSRTYGGKWNAIAVFGTVLVGAGFGSLLL